MSTIYTGYTFYEESLLMRCACAQHLMEIYMYGCGGQNYYGIEWHSDYKKYFLTKNHCVDFYFKNYEDFQGFIEKCKNIQKILDEKQISITGEPLYVLKSFKQISSSNSNNQYGKQKFSKDGYLEITQEYGYINFTRYNNNKKYVWEFCICEKDYNDFLNHLINMKIKIDNKYKNTILYGGNK